VGVVVHLRSCYSQETRVGVGAVVIFGAAIHRKHVLVWD
jgi:hypothetical protein